MKLNLKHLRIVGFAAITAFAAPLMAQDYSAAISEDDLRSLVPFGADATLKMAECGVKSYPTCTYIWGAPDSDDEARVALGARPSGNKLLTIFAKAYRPEDFDRVAGVYRDGVSVEGLGTRAVWSAKRRQLSLITEDNLVIHVNVDIAGLEDPLATATQIATYLLAMK